MVNLCVDSNNSWNNNRKMRHVFPHARDTEGVHILRAEIKKIIKQRQLSALESLKPAVFPEFQKRGKLGLDFLVSINLIEALNEGARTSQSKKVKYEIQSKNKDYNESG